ncbi:hypothetical protein [Streptococcus mutans]|uniref:hypothetical protein n=1 Tax=Streptococcus mutans TaxID=1309 RepID=UPI0002BFB2EE|nr:hypothetical protein [Streptococcus mutans]EMP65879.1 hypothetical protein D818_01448 [Streptococcus mutans KK23]
MIIEEFVTNKLHFYLQHEKSEFIVYQIINQILDNYKNFEKMINVEIASIENTDDYIAYLIFKQVSVVENSNLDRLSGDDAKQITNLCSKAKKNNKIEPKILIEYIQNNFVEIFNLPIDYIENITIDIIAEYPTGSHDEIQNYLFQNYTYFIIHQFDQFEKWFKKNPKYIKEIINVEFLEKSYWAHLSKALDILEHLESKRSSDINEITDGIIKDIFDRLLVIAKECSGKENEIRDILILETVFTKFQEFLISIKSPLANTFKSSVDEVNNFVNDYIDENGQSFSYKIPYQSILEKFKSSEIDIVNLTHKVEELNQNKYLVSRLSLLKPESKGLFDLFGSNQKTDDYFTRTHQQQLNTHLQVSSLFIYEIINDLEALIKFQTIIHYRIEFISHCLNSREDLKKVSMLFLNSFSFLNSYREENLLLLRTQCYNTNILTFVMIEKLLRSLYLDFVKDKKYVPTSITLGPLLSDSNEELKKFLGESYIRNLSFYLSKTGDGREIGHDYRNRFVHYKDVSNEMLTIQFTSQLLYLFVDILNTTFLYCQKSVDKLKSE